jgi:hypothetical protein
LSKEIGCVYWGEMRYIPSQAVSYWEGHLDVALPKLGLPRQCYADLGTMEGCGLSETERDDTGLRWSDAGGAERGEGDVLCELCVI